MEMETFIKILIIVVYFFFVIFYFSWKMKKIEDQEKNQIKRITKRRK